MHDDPPRGDDSATRTSIGAATLLKKDRLLADRYRIAGPIGAGGMGLVYRARDERLNVEVAIKVLRPERAPDQALLERFERELLLAREVSHPNVVRIHDIGQDGDLHFITMDLVSGRSLRDVLESDGALDAVTAANITAEIADGLHAAHSKGVIHRDLKPGNILLDNDGHAFISDFGVARSLHASNLTRSGMIVGSPDYLAPEQARGEDIDGRTDIYALGLMLYEMLSGELPFRSGTIEELIAQRTVGQPRDIATTGKSVPGWLRRIIYRCLARDPDDRFATAAELAQALRSQKPLSRRLPKAAVRGIGIGAGLVALAALAWFGRPLLQQDEAGNGLRMAVLPLANDTGRDELQWIAGGLGDMLAAYFAESPGIELIDTSRISDTLNDLRLDPTTLDQRAALQLAELLSADRIISGALRQAGDTLRVDASVWHGTSGRRSAIEATAATSSPNDLIAGLAQRLPDKLAVTAADGVEPQLSSSPVALEAWSRGRQALNQADTANAIPQLEAAVAADPGFALAWFHLADAYDLAGFSERANQAIVRAAEQTSDTDTRTGLQISALQAALAGDFARSRELLVQLIESYPADIPARMALAEAYGGEGRFDDAGQILQSVVADDPNHPRAWFLRGKYAIQSGDSRRAIDEYLVRDLVIQNRLKNDYGKGNAYNAMGIAYGRIGETEAARENYEKAAELRGRIGDQRGMATSLNNLARLEMIAGNFDAARASLEQAVQVSNELGDQAGLAAFTNTIGTVEEEAGNYNAALAQYREALKIRESLGDRRALTESYNNVGFAYYMLGELDNARIYWERALDEALELGNPDAEMQALQSLGLLYTARADWDDAIKAFIDALTISRELDYPNAVAVSNGYLGHIATTQGRYSAGLEQLDEAIKILQSLNDTRGLSEFGLRRAAVLIDIGLHDEAGEQLEAVGRWLEESPNLEQQADHQRLRASLNGPLSRQLLQESLALAQRSGGTAAVLRARLALAQQALTNNEVETATQLAGEVVSAAGRDGYAGLQLRALHSLARATVQRDGAASAGPVADQLLALLDTHEPFADSYQMRALAAQIFAAQNRNEAAARQSALANTGYARLRKNAPPEALAYLDERAQAAGLQDEALVDGN
ncbi:MAG: protein kinase [Gammaproteobacteria bacterium]|nr:protein kinase [Gammaproteobacteria bacterium]